MRRRMAALAACFALAALGSAALAPQAMAACTEGWVCLYNGPSWETPPKYFTDNGTQSLVPYGFNDLTSSATNSTSRWAVLREHSDGSGALACIGPYTARTFWGNWFNNQASAIVLHPYGQVPNCSGGY
jgi:Peptidase inhibitor family I36